MLPRGLLKEYASVLPVVARVFDVLCVFLGALLAFFWRFDAWSMPAIYQTATLLGILSTLIIFTSLGIYHSWRGSNWLRQAQMVTITWFSVVTILIIFAFLTKTSADYSRQWMITWVLFAWALLLLFRYSLTRVLHVMREKGWNHKRIIIVGAGTLGQSVAKNLRDASWMGLEVIGFLDDNKTLQGKSVMGIEVLGGADETDLIVKQLHADEVWLALPLRYEKRVKETLYNLRHNTVTIRFVPGIFGFRLLNHSVSDVAGMAVLDLSTTPMEGLNRLIKGLEDRVLALLILILVSPLLMFIAVGVKLSSPGPVLFKQKRHGWDGMEIKIYKFRSMVVHSEEGGKVTQAKKYDERVTKFGDFLRRTSLDEFPQFVNVLQGRMSIVGPRPHALAHNEEYKDQVEAYMLRHKVKPGITGWAQVNGFRGETDTLEKMKKRIEYDLYYIEHWSLWFDIKIIIRTIFSGFVNKNAY